MGSETLQLPRIDLSGLDPSSAGGDGWDAARAQVMRSLEAYGCFEALFDKVTPELRQALFGRAMAEVFSLPLEAKMRGCRSDVPYQGYLGQIPSMAYESLRVADAPSLEDAERFTRLMWPDGNDNFRDTVCAYANHVKDLEQIIVLMVLQSMGIEKHYDSRVESTAYGLRLSEYGVPLDQETKIAMAAHVDTSLVTIICQHEVGGLEVQTRDGEWIHVVPSPNSFTVLIGEAFEAWMNGRLRPPYHRVRITSNEKRCSTLLASTPREGYMIRAPEELVDEEHPLVYKPFYYNDYLRFRFSGDGATSGAMRAFCGVGGERMEA